MTITKQGFERTEMTALLFQGGLNTAVPVMSMQLGEAMELRNYEVNNIARYTSVLGYERFDGRQSPFDAEFVTVTVSSTTYLGAGLQIEGDTSGATAWIVAADSVTNTLALVDVSGTFNINEGLNNGSATLVSLPAPDLAASDVQYEAFELGKQTHYRNRIQAVPGSGPIRGVVVYGGTVYGVRDTEDGTGAKLYASSSTGWQEVDLGEATLLPGGSYKFITANFQGASGLDVLIGVDGVNPAFHYDGTTFTQITTGLEPAVPSCCAALPTNILVLGYLNGSLMTSAINRPTLFDYGEGAAEIAVGDEVRELQVQPNRALAVFCRTRLQVLYGTSPADFDLTTFSASLSCVPNSAQDLGDTVFLSDSGLRRLTRVQQFGDFQDVDLSIKVRNLLDRYIDRVATSFVVRRKNQYRICFTDRTGLSVTFLGPEEVLGISQFEYPHQMTAAFAGRDAAGNELVLAGGENGYVYRMETGHNFDGEPIQTVCRTGFFFFDRPEERKRFKKLMLEVDTTALADLRVRTDIDYGGAESPETTTYKDVQAQAGGAYWGGGNWDEFFWDRQVVWIGETFVTGVGRNLGALIVSRSAVSPPHTLSSMIVHWARRARRN